MTDPLTESHNAEALNAAAVLEEARQKASHSSLVSALREVLTDESGSPMLIKRIPFICTDILWIKRAIFGIFALLGTLLVALLVK